ncbi:hypothetical protein TsFJ059_008261 [Trichoderma semiorbis]|uniref:Uncharacterized protein n=1 Tax=Trichoderma semiorbis TaxID=1491008 RepID=A0A9P8KQV3_9HYPO|nr:hypothetical protein TsFJ059_008261 [Trichoderma semiorbis]
MSSRKWWENPIVTIDAPRDLDPEQERLENEEYAKLMVGYRPPSARDYTGISKEQHEAQCQALVANTFHMIEIDPADHQACFRKCVDKCVMTGVLHAHNWLQWGGYKELSVEMHQLAKATRRTGQVHILNAPSVIAAITVMSIRNMEVVGNDDLTALLINLKAFQYAHSSVEYWSADAGFGGIIHTTEPYVGPRLEGGLAIDLDAEPAIGQAVTVINTTPVPVDITFRNNAQLMLELRQFEIPHSRPHTPSPPSFASDTKLNAILADLEDLCNHDLSPAVKRKMQTFAYRVRHEFGRRVNQ